MPGSLELTARVACGKRKPGEKRRALLRRRVQKRQAEVALGLLPRSCVVPATTRLGHENSRTPAPRSLSSAEGHVAEQRAFLHLCVDLMKGEAGITNELSGVGRDFYFFKAHAKQIKTFLILPPFPK